jgi:sugar transferase (PEP-CTERM/EpsH1 system associated)
MKMVVLLSRIPYPLEKGDKLRAYHMLRELSSNHEITLCCLHDTEAPAGAYEHLASFIHRVEFIPLVKWRQYTQLLAGVFLDLPFQVLYFKQKKAMRKVHAIIKQVKPDHIVCQLLRTSEYVKTLYQYPKTIDFQDALSAGYLRRSQKASWLTAWAFREEAERLLRYEQVIFDYFDEQLMISEQDKQLINHAQRHKIKVVPNGVDTKFFTPDDTTKSFDLVFAGNMGYAPNIECVKRIVHQILPIIHAKRPNVSLLIAGAEPSKEVRALHRVDRHIHVSGWMDDIRMAYRSSKVLFAPMTIGSGMQNKILEAMSCGLPCITSHLVMRGIGHDAKAPLIIGESDQDFADRAIELLDNAERYQRIATASRQFVSEHFTWQQQWQLWMSEMEKSTAKSTVD